MKDQALTTASTGTNISNIDAMLEARAKSMRENIRVATSNITLTKGGQLRLPSGDEVDSVDLVIVDYRYRNMYYDKPFRQGEASELTCVAIGETENDSLIPLISSAARQSDVCSTCPKNAYGSSPVGRGKACQNQFVMAVMPPGGDDTDMFLIRTSPTAVSEMANYVRRMADQYGHPIKVISTFSVDESKKWARLVASASGPNVNYQHHAQFLNDAAAMVTSLPITTVATVDSDAPQATQSSGRTSRAQ